MAVLVDGDRVDRIPVSDRALAYGDGLFETIRIKDGRPCCWNLHLARLFEGCRRLGIAPPSVDLVAREVRSLARGCSAGVLKLLVTRGSGGRGYRPDPEAPARRICMRFDPPLYPPAWQTEGVVVRVCCTQASHNPALAGIKHLNRLDNVLARSEWSDPGISEGLMLGPAGQLVGGTMSNLFLWDGRTLATPVIDGCGVAGTVRSLAMGLAADHGIPCQERVIGRDALATAAGIFLTNSLIGAWPVRQVEARGLDPRRLPFEFVTDLIRAAQTL